MGRTRFIWSERVLGIGIPIAVAGLVYRFVDQSLGFSDLLRPSVVAFILFGLVMGIVTGFLVGAAEWEIREEDHRDNNG